jgi:hypothetical protein
VTGVANLTGCARWALAILAACNAAGCTTSGDAITGTSDAGEGREGAAYAPGAFGASVCGTCQEKACASEIAACTDDPGCARFQSCVFACPSGPDGNVDSSCLAGCASADASSSVTSEEIAGLSECLEHGAGTLCSGCGSDAGGGTGYAIVHETCPTSIGSANDCNTIELSLCCHTIDACMASAACQTIDTCFITCPSDDILADAGSDAGFPSCNEACIAQAPDGLAAFAAYDVCVNLRCASYAACGGAAKACGDCLAENCAQANLDMNLAPGGYGLFNCIFDCNADKNCEAACKSQYPAAVKPLDSFVACQQNLCGNACGGGITVL